MSRKANKPIPIPAGVTVAIAGQTITVKGPKGELNQTMNRVVSMLQEDNAIIIKVKDPTVKQQGAQWGTAGALLRNMFIGVTTGYIVQLEINGVGYGFELSGNKLNVKAGYTHQVVVELPDGVAAKVEKNLLTLSSHDKQLVGQVAANIRKIKKPEPYKGKGIKYIDEVIIRKQGKQAAGAAS